jgi:hypothetical protein
VVTAVQAVVVGQLGEQLKRGEVLLVATQAVGQEPVAAGRPVKLSEWVEVLPVMIEAVGQKPVVAAGLLAKQSKREREQRTVL